MLSNEAASDERIEGGLRDPPILAAKEENLAKLPSAHIAGEGIEMDPEAVTNLAGRKPSGRGGGAGAHTVTAQRQLSRNAARARMGSGVQVRISPLTETL
jgi:hypothetical protein